MSRSFELDLHIIAGSIAQDQSVSIDTAEIKYDTFVITDGFTHVPALGFQVAAIGRHHVRTVMSVTRQAIVARMIMLYKM